MLQPPPPEYVERLTRAVLELVGRPLNDTTRCIIKRAAFAAQAGFLAEHPGYVAYGEVEILERSRAIEVIAPIITREEKLTLDCQNREREKLLEQLRLDSDAAEVLRQKHLASMKRRHRKLMRLCSGRLPPATREIWPSLTLSQQYAILKDLHYSMRHGAV